MKLAISEFSGKLKHERAKRVLLIFVSRTEGGDRSAKPRKKKVGKRCAAAAAGRNGYDWRWRGVLRPPFPSLVSPSVCPAVSVTFKTKGREGQAFQTVREAISMSLEMKMSGH